MQEYIFRVKYSNDSEVQGKRCCPFPPQGITLHLTEYLGFRASFQVPSQALIYVYR